MNLIISICFFVTVMSTLVTSLQHLMVAKIGMLSICIIFILLVKSPVTIRLVRNDFIVIFFIIYVIFSILWGQRDQSAIFVHLAFFISYILFYVLVRISKPKHPSVFQILFIFILEFLIYASTNSDHTDIKAYVIGSTSVFLLSISYMGKLTKVASFGVNAALSGGRFAIASLVNFFRNPYLNYFSYLSIYFLLVYLSFTFYLSEYHDLFLGYRIFEFAAVYVNFEEPLDYIFGLGLGQRPTLRDLGSKGVIEHYGYYHNFLLTMLESLGIFGLILLFSLGFGKFFSSGKINLHSVYWGWLIVCCIEAPRDGAWPLFVVAALISNDRVRSHVANS